MALTLDLFQDGRIEVITFADPSVTCDRETYNKYLETLNKDLLGLEGEPTVFVMKKYLTQAEGSVLKDNMLSMNKDNSMKINLSVHTEEIRRSLIDIQSGATVGGLKWVKDDGDKWTSRDLIAKLEQAGIVEDLVAARKANMGVSRKHLGN